MFNEPHKLVDFKDKKAMEKVRSHAANATDDPIYQKAFTNFMQTEIPSHLKPIVGATKSPSEFAIIEQIQITYS